MRNCAGSLVRWYSQLVGVVTLMPEHNFYISVYENDSTDNTQLMLTNLDFSMFRDSHIVTDWLNTNQYGSVKEFDRVQNLANARNTALDGKSLLNNVDYVLWIEPDIAYDPFVVKELLNFRQAGLLEIDIYSAISLRPGREEVYDTWATRRDPNEEDGERFPDWRENPIREFWTTFNCLCLYRAEPFQVGLRFTAWNNRLQKFDCDTVAICETFRANGFKKIYANQMLTVEHL